MYSWPPSAEEIARAAKRMAKAEQIEVQNQILMAAIKPTDEEMAKIHTLTFLAIKSGAPSAFLSAVANMVQKPLFVPCGCWWCRLKRFLGFRKH